MWYEKLVSGDVDSLRTIASEIGVHQILEAVLEGQQRPLLTVEKLRLGAPAIWAERRKVFGFSSS